MTEESMTRRTIVDDVVVPYTFRESHRVLLQEPPEASASAPCDAIIVPSHDRPQRLGFVADLAARLGRPLLVVATNGTRRLVEAVITTRARNPECWVLTLPHAEPLPALALNTDEERGARAPSHRDVAAKRNAALAISLMLGWRTVLLVDDDVRDLRPGRVRAAGALLSEGDGLDVVSWRCMRFPDNSAVCHAGRLAGVQQDVFVGAGAMLVRIEPDMPFFPPVYNEDWLFLFDYLTERRVVDGGTVRQLVYDPFDPAHGRGAAEEFGDVLGEGLYHLLHEGLPLRSAENPTYWDTVIAERRRTIRRIREALDRPRGLTRPRRRPSRHAIASLDAARQQHSERMADDLVSFVRAWREDLPGWRSWLRRLPSLATPRDAAQPLGISSASIRSVRL